MIVAWFPVSSGCRGEGVDVFWYFVAAATAALSGSTYTFVSSLTAYRSIAVIWSLVVAVVGGFGIFMFLAL